MSSLIEQAITCPYCAERINVLIEPTDQIQEYIEDCQVCCRPITFIITINSNGELSVSVYDENETF